MAGEVSFGHGRGLTLAAQKLMIEAPLMSNMEYIKHKALELIGDAIFHSYLAFERIGIAIADKRSNLDH